MNEVMALAVVVAMAISTAACTGDDTGTSPFMTTQAASTTQASPTSAAATTTENAASTTSIVPSVADLIARSTGLPTAVQTVPDVGQFPYHVISAFGSIWVLAKHSATVTRIDATTGETKAVIPLAIDERGTLNRLAAGTDGVFVSARPLIRIDPADNHTTAFDDGIASAAVAALGSTVWTAGMEQQLIRRIDADGIITTVDAPKYGWMDLTVSRGLVWAISQGPGRSHLIAFNMDTGARVHDVAMPLADGAYPVRLVADETGIAVGVDTNGSDGPNGQLLLVDPRTAAITTTVSLPKRPEGIVLTEHHIWTSGAVIDRATLEVTNVSLGFSLALGPDGSLWATASHGSISRFAPGDFKN